jgi:hypothetical protein
LFDRSKDAGSATGILFVQTLKNSVFGAVLMSPVRCRCLCAQQQLTLMQIHDSDFRHYDFQSSFLFSLLPQEEVWHRIPDSEATDYNQSCSYDHICVGIGSSGAAIAFHNGEQTRSSVCALLPLLRTCAGLDQGFSQPTDIFNNPSLHNDSESGNKRHRFLSAVAFYFQLTSTHAAMTASKAPHAVGAGEFEVLAVELYVLKATWD